VIFFNNILFSICRFVHKVVCFLIQRHSSEHLRAQIFLHTLEHSPYNCLHRSLENPLFYKSASSSVMYWCHVTQLTGLRLQLIEDKQWKKSPKQCHKCQTKL